MTSGRAQLAKLGGGAVAAALVIALGALALVVFLSANRASAAYTCGDVLLPPSDSTNVVAPESLGRDHVAPGSFISYDLCPPTSGSHIGDDAAGPAAPGYHAPSESIGPERWLHNLEHGFVVALYKCALDTCPSPQEQDALRQFAASVPTSANAAACGYRAKVVVARFDQLVTPFALLAWNRTELVDTFDVKLASEFAASYTDNTAPEIAC